MKHISLFAGQGGFDLAAEWMGWENVAHCEINPFCQKILKYYWPNAISYADIKTTDFSNHRGKIDILSGGFPCQPYSTAGKRLGKEDERHLWPEMLRAITEIEPRWIVGENVRGLISWNGGLVFDEVQSDLETAGYEVIPFLLPACGVNAPHQRYRVWFVAHCNDRQCEQQERNIQAGRIAFDAGSSANAADTANTRPETWQQNGECANAEENSARLVDESKRFSDFQTATHAQGVGLQGGVLSWPGWTGPENHNSCNVANSYRTGFKKCNPPGVATTPGHGSRFPVGDWSQWPTVAPLCSGDDGLSSRLDNITFSKWRNESIKAAGNAIVPQVAYQIFKTIDLYEMLY